MPLNNVQISNLKRSARLVINLDNNINKVIEIESKYERFRQIFISQQPRITTFMLSGILCLSFIIVDFIASIKTFSLLRLPFVKPWLFALIYTTADGILAILSSGILAKKPEDKISDRRKYLPILVLLGIVKLALLIIYLILLKALWIQWIFVLLILLSYFALAIAGEGLLYLVGSWFYYIKKSFYGSNIMALTNEMKDKYIGFKNNVSHNGADHQEAIETFSLPTAGIKAHDFVNIPDHLLKQTITDYYKSLQVVK